MSLRPNDKIFVTGHKGLFGSAVVEELRHSGYENLITVGREELDLADSSATEKFLKQTKPDTIIHCAALVGGIHANSARPAEFLRQNLLIQNNVIHGAHLADVNTLAFFGSNCMYPLSAKQPMPETELLQGPIEPTNLAYGAAKIAGYVQCQSYFQQYGRNYMTLMPASLYGPNDNYDLNSCHVTPALILRFHLAKKQSLPSFSVWGTGKPRRELLFSRDAARGVIHALLHWHAKQGPLNLGFGSDLSVAEIAETIREVVGFKGKLEFDLTKPDGNPRKLLDSTKIGSLGFKASTPLQEGLKLTYEWLLSGAHVRGVKKEDL